MFHIQRQIRKTISRQNVNSLFKIRGANNTYRTEQPDCELVSALQFHFSLFIQRTSATAQFLTVQDVVDVLKRLEMMDDHDLFLGKTRSISSEESHYAFISPEGVTEHMIIITLCHRLESVA